MIYYHFTPATAKVDSACTLLHVGRGHTVSLAYHRPACPKGSVGCSVFPRLSLS